MAHDALLTPAHSARWFGKALCTAPQVAPCSTIAWGYLCSSIAEYGTAEAKPYARVGWCVLSRCVCLCVV